MNILKNVILFLSSLIVALCIAEYAAGKIDIEFLSGRIMYMGIYNSRVSIAPDSSVNDPGKITRFDIGNCYSSDSTGLLPLQIINPADGKTWQCVVYNKKLRRQGYNPERKRKIAIVGDSFAFGHGVKESDTLGYLLNEKYTGVNFQNLGVPGSNIDDVVRTCGEIEKSNPDLEEVIYIYNLNDVRLSKTVESGQEFSISEVEKLRKDEEPRGSVAKILSKSALMTSIRKVWKLQRIISFTVQNYKDMYLGEENRQEFVYTINQMKYVKEMLARRGISFRVIIYPQLYKDILGRYPFEKIHIRIVNACNERGVECLDGYEPFKGYYSLKKFIVHPVDHHPNGIANRLMVDYIRKKDFI